MKNLKLAFIYKKHDTLSYMTFLYTRIQTLHRTQENFRYIFIYKKPDTLCHAIYHGMFEIGGGGGAFFLQKEMHLALHFYMQETHFALRFYVHKA